MLHSLTIDNFKAFSSRQTAHLAPITLIYGPNSGGKSSIIQSLLLQKQSMESKINTGIKKKFLIPNGAHVDLGQSKSMHHGHNLDKPISFGMQISDPAFSASFNTPAQDGDVLSVYASFKDFGVLGKRPLPELVKVQLGIMSLYGRDFNIGLQREAQKSPPLLSDEEELISGSQIFRENFFRFRRHDEVEQLLQFCEDRVARPERYRSELSRQDALWLLEQGRVSFRPMLSVANSTFLPSQIRGPESRNVRGPDEYATASRVLFTIVRAYERALGAVSYLGPLRSRPKRVYEYSRQFTNSVGVSGEYAIDALGEKIDSEGVEVVSDRVNRWLEDFEIPYLLKVDEVGDEVLGDIAKLMLVDKRTGVTVAATDVGFGIGQILPIIIEGILADQKPSRVTPPRVICVEQPELHLHPRLQAHIGDFFIETHRQNGCQWIAETHSESILLRIQRRIREGLINSSDVSVVFVNPTGRAGSEIMQLRMSKSGDFIDEWPGGFFEEGFREMFG
ncbi:AAA family ATPase [Paraburkholderia sp. J76]|uniref:AAA family ATPase n=1 Tax=Paraburkholderia sp. J76 TaxID=2805439 RepID=UPI002ABE86C2|nr:AAA family ATPase [Paraburkholderia sp. J76]